MADPDYPLDASTRQTDIQIADGVTKVWGPFGFLIFDVEDVTCFRRLPGEAVFSELSSGVTIKKTAKTAWATFTATFAVAPVSGAEFYIAGSRTPSRASAITKAATTQLSTVALDKELTQLAIVQQELKRDLGQAVTAVRGVTPPIFTETGDAGDLMVFGEGGAIEAGPQLATLPEVLALAYGGVQSGEAVATAGQTEFSVGDYTSIIVFKDGVKLAQSAFTAASPKITLSTPATAGQRIAWLGLYATDRVSAYSKAQVDGLIAGRMRSAPNKAAIKAMDTVEESAVIDIETGFLWVWRTGNFAASVTADTDENSFLAANAVATSVGAWQRLSPFVPPLIADRAIRFDRYRAKTDSDTAAVKAMIYDAFRTGHDAYSDFVDFCGMTIYLTEPLDAAVISGRSTNYKTVTFRNGCWVADNSLGLWVSSGVGRSTSIKIFSNTHTTASAISNMEPGMCLLATGENAIELSNGIARETYVTAITGTNTYTTNTSAYRTRDGMFYVAKKFPYFITFKGFTWASRVKFLDMNFRCLELASGIQMAADGNDWSFHNLWFHDVKDRAITDWNSCSSGCEIHLVTAWSADNTATRTSYGVTMSGGDSKMSNSRFINFLCSYVGHRSGYTITKCHNWQSGNTAFTRQSAFLFTKVRPFVTINGCYIDNGGVEISNESEDFPGYSFNNIVISACNFTMNEQASEDSRYVMLSIVGYAGLDENGVTQDDTGLRGLHGFQLGDCTFRRFAGTIGAPDIPQPDQVSVYGSGGLDITDIKGLSWNAAYFNITAEVSNPNTLKVSKSAVDASWDFDFAGRLPFGLKPQTVKAVAPGGLGGMKDASDVITPAAFTSYQGSPNSKIVVKLDAALKGDMAVTVDACQAA